MRGTSVILAAASALLIPSISAECSNTSPLDIAILAACGNQDEIVSCLTEGEKCLQGCLVSSGCSPSDAQSFKLWYENGCEEVRSFDGDLRRRQLIQVSVATNQQEATTTAAHSPTKAKQGAKTTSAAPTAAATTEPGTTAAQPTTTEQTTAQTSAPTTASVQTTPQSTTSAPDLTVTALSQITSQTTPLVCHTTEYVSTSWCTTTTEAGSTGSTCIPTSTPSVSCNKGLLCSTTAKGEDVCMRIINTPPLSGIIVSTCLGVFFASMFGSLIFMACRSRSAANKAKKQAAALAIAASSKSGAASPAMASEAYLPLIHAAAPEGRRRDVSADYGSGSRSPSLQRLATPTPAGGYQDGASRGRTPSVGRKPVVGLSDRSPLTFDDDDIGYGRQR